MMRLVRFHDWPQRLRRAIDDRRSLPYRWGQNDCALFAADMIAAMTGEDLGAPFRGAYSDEAGARRTLEAHGWADISALADALLPRRLERWRRGDVLLIDAPAAPGGAFLTIVWQGGAVGPGARRPIVIPVHAPLACWSVG